MNFAETLAQPLALPCGSTLKNRIAKSAMSETLGTVDNHVTEALVRLYERWGNGGTGLLITGNVMVDQRHLGEPNNVVLEDKRDFALLQRWASAARQQGAHVWMQLNHPGKQIPAMLASGDTLAPSAVAFSDELSRHFRTPRAMTHEEIQDVIGRFARSAAIAREAGFTGIQIHGAHGYLVSQFLSGHHNQRDDEWGGSLENRMRFPVAIYRAVREAVGDTFPVSIKLNSADFQRGGFTEAESMAVAETLAAQGLDLLEISGGNYERPAMAGKEMADSTRQREAYFLDYAEQIRRRVQTPLMVTGGFRSASGMAEAVNSAATDLVGLARPLAVEPDLPRRVLAGEAVTSVVQPRLTGIKAIDRMAMMEVVWFARQLHRMGRGKDPVATESVLMAFIRSLVSVALRSSRTRRMKLRANSG